MSQFVVSARKYRPQRFEDVVGQQHIAQTLKNALATDHVAHAFLFCGPRGVGKTTCARILAKILNCHNRTPDFEACNQCSSCTSFNENASFNIIELDAASNNSVEHIRGLVEQVRFRPQEGQYKVFIIDEVHMLSNAAFNAFLKTLEEPPPYAIFILATTEKHKIIPTILSRCQIFDFRRISVGDMVGHLQKICVAEGIQTENDALHVIAQKADGALRDALSIFDRITSFSGKTVRYADVIDNLNVLDYDHYFQVTDALLAQDLPAVLQRFDQILRQGFEADTFISGLAEHLRNILVCQDEATLSLLEAGDNLRERYRAQAALAPASFLLTGLNLCNECDIHFKMARHKRLHVEMTLIKLTHILQAVQAAQSGVSPSVEKKTADLTSPPLQPASNKPPSNAVTAAPPPPGPAAATSPALQPAAVVAENAPQYPAGNATQLDSDAMNSLSAQIKLGVKKAEAISFNLDDYDRAVERELADLSGRTSLLTLENAQTHWRAFAQAHESQNLRQAMMSANLHIDDTFIVATVGLNIHANLIQGENSRLMDYLRHHLQDREVKVKVKIDEAKIAEIQATPKLARPLTNKDKLDRMKEINPVITDLIRHFDLKPED